MCLKRQVGLLPIELAQSPSGRQFGYVLLSELGTRSLQLGSLCYFICMDKRYLVRVSDFRSCHDVSVPVFECLSPSAYLRRKVLLEFKGCALGEKKGAKLFIYRDALSVIASRKDYSENEVDFLEWDVSDVDVNEKVYAYEIALPHFFHLVPGLEKQVVMECKYRFRSESLLEVFQKQQLMWSA